MPALLGFKKANNLSVPTFISVGATGASTGTNTVPLPAGYQVGDLFLLVIEGDQGAAYPVTGYTDIKTFTTNSYPNDCTIDVKYKIVTSSESAPVVPDGGDHTSAAIYLFRGCSITSPINTSAAGSALLQSSPEKDGCLSVTTSLQNCLIVGAVVEQSDTVTSPFSNPVQASLSSLVTLGKFGTTLGNGGNGIVVAGLKATAGATGTIVFSGTAPSGRVAVTVALTA